MVTKIKITTEENTALEKLHYEVNARKSLLSYIMTTMPKDNSYLKQYHYKFDLAYD